MVDVKLSQLAAQSPASVAAGAALWSGKGFIQGLVLEYVSTTQVRVGSGAAHVPDAGFPVELASAVTKTISGIGNSAWGHIYLVYAAGVAADIEVVTTAPAAPYSGTARAKSGAGGTSRRYLGSILTDAAGAIVRFLQAANLVIYPSAAGAGAAPFRVLANKTTAAEEAVSLSAVIPSTATGVFARFFFNRTVGDNAMNFGPLTGLPKLSNITSPGAVFFTVPVTSSLTLYVQLNNTISDGNGGVYVDVNGYTYER